MKTKTLNFFINGNMTEMRFEAVDTRESLRQRIISLLYFFAKTYFINPEGFDYLNSKVNEINAEITSKIMDRFQDEIIDISRLSWDFSNNKLSINIDIITIYGDLNVRT